MSNVYRVLVVAIHYPVCSGRYVFDALKRLGHDVRSAGPQPQPANAIWGTTVEERFIWEPSPPEKGWKPDVVLCMDSGIGFNRSGDMPHIVYGVDNHVRDYRQNKWDWDHLFLAHGGGFRMGEDNVTHLPCAYDPAVFKAGPAWDERTYDVGLYGISYPQRNALLYALHQVLTTNRKIAYGYGAVYEQFAGIYQQSRISLVVSANGDVAQRVWETAACGCLVIKDANHDDEALGLENGKNCLIYHREAEATHQVRWALDHPDEAQKIARAGTKHLTGGTWDNRVTEILLWLAEQKGASDGEGS